MELQLARALSNPIRLRILGALAVEGTSTDRLAEELELDRDRVAYHAAVLIGMGCVRSGEAANADEEDASLELAQISSYGRRPGGAAPRRLPLVLDRAGWERVSEIIERSLEQIAKAAEESAERLRGSGEQGIESTIVVDGLASPTPPGEDD